MYKIYFLLITVLIACKPTVEQTIPSVIQNNITCNDRSCYGTYTGPEFINGDDIAHQFSNHIATAVGDQLKELYASGNYSKVDLNSIKMTTQGMGTGTVTYYLNIPFVAVKNACDSYTSFDHCGGWNHAPALERRKKELDHVTMTGHYLNISNLKTTTEGLQEYWIQWKNKVTQASCE